MTLWLGVALGVLLAVRFGPVVIGSRPNKLYAALLLATGLLSTYNAVIYSKTPHDAVTLFWAIAGQALTICGLMGLIKIPPTQPPTAPA